VPDSALNVPVPITKLVPKKRLPESVVSVELFALNVPFLVESKILKSQMILWTVTLLPLALNTAFAPPGGPVAKN